MRGFPKHLNTRQDVDNVMALYPDQAKAAVQGMLHSAEIWTVVKKLGDKETGVVSATSKVVELAGDSGTVERYQAELKTDDTSRLYQVGLTKALAQEIVGLEAVAAEPLQEAVKG